MNNDEFIKLEAEARNERRKELQEAYETKRTLEQLLEDHKFESFLEMLGNQVELRVHNVFVMPTGLDGEIQNIYARGEVAGLKVAMNLAKVHLEGAKETISKLAPIVERESNEDE